MFHRESHKHCLLCWPSIFEDIFPGHIRNESRFLAQVYKIRIIHQGPIFWRRVLGGIILTPFLPSEALNTARPRFIYDNDTTTLSIFYRWQISRNERRLGDLFADDGVRNLKCCFPYFIDYPIQINPRFPISSSRVSPSYLWILNY